jgi:hypothetical protein
MGGRQWNDGDVTKYEIGIPTCLKAEN